MCLKVTLNFQKIPRFAVIFPIFLFLGDFSPNKKYHISEPAASQGPTWPKGVAHSRTASLLLKATRGSRSSKSRITCFRPDVWKMPENAGYRLSLSRVIFFGETWHREGYITNPNNALLKRGQKSKLPYILASSLIPSKWRKLVTPVKMG